MNDKIRRRFEVSAGQYDLYTALHRGIADKLLSRLEGSAMPEAVLDVGCGTGYLTRAIRERFSSSIVVGVDFAGAMLRAARSPRQDISWVLADCRRLPFSDGSFSIVTSNLAYQWAGDLVSAFSEARRVAAPGGILACTLFGHDTCRELFQALADAKKGRLQFGRLPGKAQVRQALADAGFSKSAVDGEHRKITFRDMHALMAWFKAIGASGLLRQGFLGPDTLARAAFLYKERFSNQEGIEATFEVIWVYAEK